MMEISTQLLGLHQCPHCTASNPVMRRVWLSAEVLNSGSAGKISRADGGLLENWAVFCCSTCGALVTARGGSFEGRKINTVVSIYPEAKKAHEDIPVMARTFLQQAFNTLHAPDAAAMTAGSAVDAMLKACGYIDGSLYSRIDKALSDNLLTQGMADWAHEVRLGSNRPRHADENQPHVSIEEAKQSVEFAEALGQFLFVLTAKMQRAIAKAKEISETKG